MTWSTGTWRQIRVAFLQRHSTRSSTNDGQRLPARFLEPAVRNPRLDQQTNRYSSRFLEIGHRRSRERFPTQNRDHQVHEQNLHPDPAARASLVKPSPIAEKAVVHSRLGVNRLSAASFPLPDEP